MYCALGNKFPSRLLLPNKRWNIFQTPKNSNSSMTVEVQPYKLHCLKDGPDVEVSCTKEEALKYYEQMMTIRRLENASSTLYKAKFIRGFCHLYSGQEACAVGMKAVMRDTDSIITSYRAHGWAYLSGVSPLGVLAELTGRISGCSRGKGGSMHMYGNNFYGGNGIVGAQVPLGAGLALYSKYKKTGGVCLACYGDGAANQGQVAESFNLAQLLKLPVIFVIENNRYGMGTASKRSSMNIEYYTRGDVIPGIWVDGMDILAVRNATAFVIDHAVNTGPILMEVFTYRYTGHSMSDPGTSYRTREEVQEVRDKQDPIAQFRGKCLKAQLLSEDEIKTLDDKIKKEMDAVTEKAKVDKEIGLDELAADTYSLSLEPIIRGCVNRNLPHKLTNKPKNIK